MDALGAWWDAVDHHVATVAVVASAVGALWIVIASHRISRRRATLDIILQTESDKDLIRARKIFTRILEGNEKPEFWGMKENRKSDEAHAIRTVLNIHELMAVSIQEGVIDERVWRRWYNRGYISDYNEMVGYIKQVRAWKNNPALYKEFELLAQRWERDQRWYAPPGFFKRKYEAAIAFLRA